MCCVFYIVVCDVFCVLYVMYCFCVSYVVCRLLNMHVYMQMCVPRVCMCFVCVYVCMYVSVYACMCIFV